MNKSGMNSPVRKQPWCYLPLLLLLGSAPGWSQERDPDHSQMNHSQMDHSQHDMHSMHDMSDMEPDADSTPDSAMDMGHTMEHGDLQMQGGRPPADARDPHAWSGGYTLTDGPYTQPGPRQLKLADEHYFWGLLGDRLEYDSDGDSGAFDLQGWYGTTYNRLTLKLEGEVADSRLEESQTELLWSHAISAYFNSELGLRFDQYEAGPERQWLALGLQGLAPYWFELDATAYVGDEGRTALSVEAEYDLRLSRRLVLQPRAELALYGKSDEDNGIGSGLSQASLGVRLRYEISPQLAPYIGVERWQKFGNTADLADAAGDADADTLYLLGLKFWF